MICLSAYLGSMLPIARHATCAIVLQIVTLVALTLSGSTAVNGQPARGILLYYSNETPAEALGSENYRIFLDVLTESKTASAKEIHDALIDDVSDAATIFYRDVEALRLAARRTNVDLFVFSNALALQNVYLVFEPQVESGAVQQFAVERVDDNMLLRLSPLSRPEYLRTALMIVLKQFNNEPVDVAMIVRSHGSNGIPLMPRVNVDFTKMNTGDILRALDDVEHDDLKLPEIKLQGTSQVGLWSILSEVHKETGARFPLIFLSSCESGPQQFREVMAIPSSVRAIVHSGRHGMSSQLINYESIFSTLKPGEFGIGPVVRRLIDGLSRGEQELHNDTPLTAWRWPVAAWLSGLPLWTLGFPVIVSILCTVILNCRLRWSPSVGPREQIS